MILKDGTKHACRSCITGHRSSKCVHHDRELFPIAKKGRPSTQCKDCKQRGTPGGRCECQLKRKPKAKAGTSSSANGSGQSTSYSAEGSTSRRESGATQFSSFPTSEDGSYPRMMGYPAGGMDGMSTRATNSSASSPSHLHQTFAINHAPLDPQAVPAGLPYPHAEAPFAYNIHHDGQSHNFAGHHLDHSQHARLADGASRSRPPTAGEEDVPWWLYRAGYSPNPGLPYEPPGTGGAPVQGTPGVYADYAHYLPQPSPYMLNTPGGPASQPSPAFVWHNNATSYRDYMATQQVANYHSAPHDQQSSGTSHAQEQQSSHPGMNHHHHSLPYLHHSASSEPKAPSHAPHSAPLPLSTASHQAGSHYRRTTHDPTWTSMSTESSNSGNYVASSVPHDRRPNSNAPVPQLPHNVPRTEDVPPLTYESGASHMTSTESLISPISSSTSLHPGYAGNIPPVDRRYESKPLYSHIHQESPENSLRERRSTSFDQVASRASPINLRLPEDRKKRKLEADI
ncbi:hypothetical protein P389DRAFT_64618 [Cystobasidium minutum MCA 4210]|uniref:uncharacterized protein n=1 Tax=Cystobasidium minutum MCA 4210 TaxID=1397322 RepID=UPI0034CF7F8F|eukprot:jgi/Rhomi1/64618/CE64617_503